MKIFGFEIRKFKEQIETVEAIETWIVKWLSAEEMWRSRLSVDLKENHLAFPSKTQADSFAEELLTANKLLGHKLPKPEVYIQKTPKNN